MPDTTASTFQNRTAHAHRSHSVSDLLVLILVMAVLDVVHKRLDQRFIALLLTDDDEDQHPDRRGHFDQPHDKFVHNVASPSLLSAFKNGVSVPEQDTHSNRCSAVARKKYRR